MKFKIFSISIFTFLIINHCSVDRNIRQVQQYSQGRMTANEAEGYISGVCSYYGEKFHGRKTANGEIFDMYAYTAAHKTLPFGTILEVENLSNNKKVVVRINDRGPFVRDRILDLSYASAIKIDMIKEGTAKFKAKILR
jgi:rare lipoprotein A